MMDCVFCAIVAGEAEASIVHEDAAVLAFADIRPATRGHLLVIPRLHVPYLSWTEEFLAAKVFGVAQQLTTALRRSALECAGVNLFLAEGAAAGQQVDHVHIHVIPRFADDGFGMRARFTTPERSELDEVAAIVRGALEPEDLPEDRPGYVACMCYIAAGVNPNASGSASRGRTPRGAWR